MQHYKPRRGPQPRGPQTSLEAVRAAHADKERARHEAARLAALEQEEAAVAGRIAREKAIVEGRALSAQQKAFLENDPRSLKEIAAQAIHDAGRMERGK